MTSINYNPDVLLCLANLSNDEVFTPPELANSILDLLPKDIWKNKDAKFLDPVSKSGVFLREITKRLIVGLEDEIPDLQTRVNHILKNQVFGIAITELTSLLSKRTLYCAKSANSDKSICNEFENEDGNIRYKNINHTFKSGKCEFCGANEDVYSRDDDMETHAYEFIHTNNPKEIFNMKFDVIVGNPPYQLSDGGGRESSATSLYDKFVSQALKLNPKYLTMIIPSRWYSGGKGLNEFRNKMLSNEKISQIHDFPNTSDCFPGVNIRGGICYFLYDFNHKGLCKIFNYVNSKQVSMLERPLKETGIEIFIRYNEAINILHKVKYFNEQTYGGIVSSRKPFGIESNFSKFMLSESKTHNIKLYKVGGVGFIEEKDVVSKKELIDKIKVIVSKASPGDDTYPHKIISEPIIALPKSVCTETYLVIDILENENQAKNLIKYMKTNFFRFMMSLVKNTQNITKGVFVFVPKLNIDEEWTDEKLYKKYKLKQDEIDFIATIVKKMDSSDE